MRDPDPLLILGAGPIGLDAALAASERGLDFRLLEAGEAAGAAVRSWGHVRLFTPWSMNASPRMRRALKAAGRSCPDGDACPTGDELVGKLLAPLAELPAIAPRLDVDRRVVAVGRQSLLKHELLGAARRSAKPFRLLVRTRRGEESLYHAWTVLDCTGSSTFPNPLGDGGIPAPGEVALAGDICHDIPDLVHDGNGWRGQTILLVGAGHSAQTAARGLARLANGHPGTHVVWVLRQEVDRFAPIADDPLAERARLVATARELAAGACPAIDVRPGLVVDGLRRAGGRFEVTLRERSGAVERVTVDRVLALTGRSGDHLLYRQLQVQECYATSGPMKLAAALLGELGGDCLKQTTHGVDTLTHPEPGFFILGSKSYGRNNTFLMRVGWEQIDEVFSAFDERGRLRVD